MKAIFTKFDMLPQKKKMALVTAVVMTLALIITVPSYAWFNEQKKAAEMYKVEFPNALYLNAAQREDRMYFNLNAVSPYEIDPVTGGLKHNANGEPIPVTSQKYVFSVSGKNTSRYKMQLAHTNNNQFTYKIYEATEYAQETDIPSGTDEDLIVQYAVHANSHNENDLGPTIDGKTISESGSKYYVHSTTEVDGEYKNTDTSTPMKAGKNDIYFDENYKVNGQRLTNIEAYDVASYWQSENISVTLDTNKKFCHYYVLEVTWEKRTGNTFTNKETDMVYISATRN